VVTDGLSVQTVAVGGKCLFRSLSILLEDEGQYSKLRQKRYKNFVLCLRAKSFNHHLTTVTQFKSQIRRPTSLLSSSSSRFREIDNCWPVPVSFLQEPLQWSALIYASWCVFCQ
jgi:hypothetical protein